MAFENHYLDHFDDFDCHLWRKHNLWNEDFDLLFTRLTSGLKQVFEKNSGRYAPPGSSVKTMSLEEFIEMFDRAGLFNDHFG